MSSQFTSPFLIKDHILRAQHTRERIAATELGQENALRVHVRQYIPKSNSHPRPGDVTIIGAIADAFPKEMYEPLWEAVMKGLEGKGKSVRAIWVADPVNQGESGVLNERILGPDPSWFDHARDLMFLINQFQDEIPHPIVGIGHSMGASHLAHLALLHPRLMDAVVLMDPVIQRGGGGSNWAAASTYRRDLWPSRQVAAEKLRSSAALKLWDPRVLEAFIQHGLRELPTEQYPNRPADSKNGDVPVTLQTTKAQEVYNYIQPVYHDERLMVPESERHRDFSAEDLALAPDAAFNRSEKIVLHRRLPEIRPSTLFVFGATSEVSSAELRKEKLDITGTGPGGSGGAKAGRVKEVVIQCGHLVPLEKPDESGEACARFVSDELDRWKREEKERWEVEERLTREQRVGINELWKKNIGGPPGKRREEETGATKL
ncbi:unnamed protein product [Zymoseptoria tritici ST99CH_1E4]|uniref:AB hydrolase-1 domain-containing protein n=1 Tax=Zymoseptoria tritici ST99CH_1E4 TaxID=1276532 RepID=A0A2H1G649_ZYMTR|nr:unnamed protein product [Zymoseptoria tritici ST99CH_1E4]